MHDPVSGLAPLRRFGPWAAGLDPGERLARLRSLRALARVLAGPRASGLVELLRQAETDDMALMPAADALDRLPSVDLRRVLGSYAGLARPLPPARHTAGRASFARPAMQVTARPAGPRQGRHHQVPVAAVA